MPGRFSIEAVFKAVDRMTAPIDKMTRSSSRFAKTIRRDFAKAQRKVEQLGRSIRRSLGRGISTALRVGVAGIAIGLAIATSEFLKFDQAIVGATAQFKDINVATVEGREVMDTLSKAARKMGSETQFSAAEAAEGLMFLAKAGFTSTQAMSLLPGVVDLATIANIDLARATDITSDALGAFGLMTTDTGQLSKNMTRLMDVMARTITSTNTNMEQLFETMKFAAPAFTGAGQSLETFAAIAGRMAANSIKASMAGTSMRFMIARLQDPTPKAAKALDMFGLSVEKITKEGKLMDMVDILVLMEKGSKKLTPVQRNAALSALAGKNAFSAWVAIMNEGVEQTILLKESLLRAQGASKKMADFMRSAFIVRLKILGSSLIELGITFVKAFEKKGGDALKSITLAVQKFDIKPLIEGIKSAFTVFSDFWNFIKPFLPFILTLVVAFKAYSIAMTIAAAAQLALNTAMGLSPIAKIIIAIAALSTLIIAITGSWDNMGTSLKISIGVFATVVSAIGLLILFINRWKAAQFLLNAVMNANPIGLIIIAVVSLIDKINTVIKRFLALKRAILGGKAFTVEGSQAFADEFFGGKKKEKEGPDIGEKQGTLTPRQALQQITQKKETTNRLIVENQSNNKLRQGGQTFGKGQSVLVPQSG